MNYQWTIMADDTTGHTRTIERSHVTDTARLCAAMTSLGMVHPTPFPDFPDSDPLTGDDFRDEQPITDRSHAFLRALRAVRIDHGSHGDDRVPGIPGHKLASCDDWHVTAPECAEALRAYDAARTAGTPHSAELADDVVPFLREAAAFRGFRVS